MSRRFRISHILVLLALLCLSACAKKGGDNISADQRVEFTTNCGVIIDGSLTNPANGERGKLVTVREVVDVNLVEVEDDGGNRFLVMSQGVGNGTSYERRLEGRNKIEGMGRRAVFFEPDAECAIELSGGERAAIGHLVSLKGDSFSEMVLEGGYADTDNGKRACHGEMYKTCYEALEDQGAQRFPDTSNNNPTNDFISFINNNSGHSGGSGSSNGGKKFLWKPVSDKGSLVILVDDYNASIKIKGSFGTKTGRNTGASNGFGTTSRFSETGCSMGSNITVYVNNRKETTIKNGCNRVQY